MAHRSANATLERFLEMMDTLNLSLSDAGIKIQSWNINDMGQKWMLLGALIFGSGVLSGMEGGRVVLILFGLLGLCKY